MEAESNSAHEDEFGGAAQLEDTVKLQTEMKVEVETESVVVRET